MRLFILIACLSCMLLTSSTTLKKSGWKKLFNGKDFQGWHMLPGGTWTVEDGVIVGKCTKEDERHGLLITDKTFRDFEVEVTYKAVRGNSGLYFRVKEVGGWAGVNGFQAEIDADKDAGGLYETNGRGWVVQPTPEDVKKYYKPGEWNKMRVTAIGGDVTVTVNGITSAQIKNDPIDREGRIALQLHGSQDMAVMFKDVRIRELHD